MEEVGDGGAGTLMDAGPGFKKWGVLSAHGKCAGGSTGESQAKAEEVG